MIANEQTSILCVDVGTSRVKAALVSAGNGKILCMDSARIDRTASPNFQNVEEWYFHVSNLVRGLAQKTTWAKPASVSLTGNMHALLGVDSSGKPVADAELWCSTLASKESAFLNEKYKNYLTTTFGNASIPTFTLPKILRMEKETPELYRNTAFFLQSKDYVAYRLTGKIATEPTDATGTLLCRLDNHSWDEGFMQELKIDARKFPEIIPSVSILGGITPQAARETGLAEGTPVVIGSGDLATAALGAATDEQTFSLTLGTAGQLMAIGKRGNAAKIAGKLFVFAYSNPRQELYLGSVPGGGFSLEWLSHLHNVTMDRFFELASTVRINESLPIFLPYILGRGAPYMDYEPCGGWRGLEAKHTQADIFLSGILGTLAALRQSAEILEALCGTRRKVVMQALACREKVVRDAACSLFHGKNNMLPANQEASLLGAAMIAAVATGFYDSFEHAQKAMFLAEKLPNCTDDTMQMAEKLFRKYLQFAEDKLTL